MRQITLQVTGAQYDRLHQIARDKGIMSLSTFIRSTLVQALELPTVCPCCGGEDCDCILEGAREDG